MKRIPIIASFGGINAAGRSSFHYGYRRMIIESLSDADRQEVLLCLAQMMGLVSFDGQNYIDAQGKVYDQASIEQTFSAIILEGTLIRRIESSYFDPDHIAVHDEAELNNIDNISFEFSKRKLPETLPDNWLVEELDSRKVKITVKGQLPVKIETTRKSEVSSAGQIPSGFVPANLYNSRYHPRGLTMTVFAAADAINSLGIEWQQVMNAIRPDEIAVYASSIAGQIDENGLGGVLQSSLKAKRVSSKQLALGLNSMPADFINAYVCGSMGATGSMAGACATFLYNLRLGVDDIHSGRRRVVIVGSSEAPILPEVMEGFDAMSALGKDEQIRKIDGADKFDHRRASRPFGENAGFTIAEGAQYIILMDDELVIELGADIYGAVNDVFVNADGFKKSISSPGPGNYVTMAKAVASARAIVGDEVVRKHSFVQAHGSSTPQNRVTESEILHKVAEAFDIENWPVGAVKAYVGHTLASASGDQLIATLGVFKYGYLHGIKTIDKVADDVRAERLTISKEDIQLDNPQVAFLNSKGFGGNNATASILSPFVVEKMLADKYSQEEIEHYHAKRVTTRKQAKKYDAAVMQGDYRVIYVFGENMIDESQIKMNSQHLSIPGFAECINLNMENPYI